MSDDEALDVWAENMKLEGEILHLRAENEKLKKENWEHIARGYALMNMLPDETLVGEVQDARRILGGVVDSLRAENEKLREELLHWKYEVTEMTDTILARIMWDAYAVQAGGKTFDGKPLPTWEELGEERQACWLAAASAAAAALKETGDE